MSASDSHLLDYLQIPALLLSGRQVAHANTAAAQLLGAHITGDDVRIALRDPRAVEVILGESGGRARIEGLSVGGSVWEVDCHVLPSGDRLVCLYDRSVQVSVARSHADFVANASHELRTPLATVIGYAETLLDPRAGDDPPTRERFLKTIRHEAQRLQALVADLMSLSRIEATKHDAPSAPVDMVALAREVAGEFVAVGPVDVSGNAPSAVVAGDRTQLAQVLRNLIDNAFKYGGADVSVAVTLEITETGWLLIAVQDTGEGIAPEHLPRLTERFYRADASRSRAAGGTGLGLSIVKHIVERHRGRFEISSRPGEGTTASLMLPLHRDD